MISNLQLILPAVTQNQYESFSKTLKHLKIILDFRIYLFTKQSPFTLQQNVDLNINDNIEENCLLGRVL
jgi:hypothetical protein